MSIIRRRPFGQNYAFVVIGVIFLALLAAAGLRSTPGVLILPLEQAFGWGRSTTAMSAGIGIFLYGMVGPFAAALMASFGLRRTVLAALALMALSTGASAFMTQPWHLVLTWGVMSGIGSGAVAIVLGATIVNRWFVTNRGLMMGLLTASTATGTLVFLPALAWLAQSGGWRPVVITVSIAAAAMIPLVWLLVPERPADAGLVPYGTPPGTVPAEQKRTGILAAAFGSLARAARTRAFWYLFATFFVCGFTTNGLVGTHLIALCGDMGIPEVRAAGLLALMGVFDLVGTTLSGWLTDRYDPRKLLFVYYGLRGLSLIYLPYSDFSSLQPHHLRGLLRAGLDRHRAPHPAPGHRGLRRARCPCRLRLDRGRPPDRRRHRGRPRRPAARYAGRLPEHVHLRRHDRAGGGGHLPRHPARPGGQHRRHRGGLNATFPAAMIGSRTRPAAYAGQAGRPSALSAGA
jgi:MFS family permease